mmetsp:Transcript_22146/g.35572  ORF Transcript_22146/g.35572 Transcript_22146/m.35572 type:complete len:262 (-) Transcript_22146:243-1028(-)
MVSEEKSSKKNAMQHQHAINNYRGCCETCAAVLTNGQRSLGSVGFLRVAPCVHEVLEPLVCLSLTFGRASLAALEHGSLQSLLHGWSGHCWSAHEEVAALLQKISADECRLLCHLVSHKDHLGWVMRLVELEGTDQSCEHTLALVHLPLLLIEELLFLTTAAVEHNHWPGLDALLLLVELVLHEGANGGNACAEADHDHGRSVVCRELEGAADHGAWDLGADCGPLNELGAGAGFHLSCALGLPLVDDHSELHTVRLVLVI